MVETINQEALIMAMQLIKNEIITLDDIPKQLANTIANIYYKYAVIYIEAAEAKGQPPKSIFRESGGYVDKIYKYVEYCNRVQSDLEAAPRYVKILRDAKKENSPEYDGLLNFVLDTLKYNIENAIHKPEIVRKLQRPFQKVDETEGLINLMKF